MKKQKTNLDPLSPQSLGCPSSAIHLKIWDVMPPIPEDTY